MPVDLGLADDQLAIQQSFRSFFAAEAPLRSARAAEPLGFDRSLWARLAGIEAPGMGVAEALSGGGATLSQLVVVTEELGRQIAPVPLIEHLVASQGPPRPRSRLRRRDRHAGAATGGSDRSMAAGASRRSRGCGDRARR